MASAGCMVLNPTEAEEHDPCPRASRINARVAALEANDELQDQEIENLQIANRNRYLSRDRVLFQGGAMVGYGFDAAAIAGAGWDHPLACNVRGECGGRFVLAAHFGWDRQDPSIGVTMEVGRLLRERLTLGGFIGYHRDFGADDPFPESQTLLTGVSAEIFKGVERRVSLVINAGYCGTDDDGTWRDGAGGNIVIRLRP